MNVGPPDDEYAKHYKCLNGIPLLNKQSMLMVLREHGVRRTINVNATTGSNTLFCL